MEKKLIDELRKKLKSGNRAERQRTAYYPKLTPELISIALKDSDDGVRYQAIRHPNVREENIEIALGDSFAHVREVAISRHTASVNQIDRALRDKERRVRLAAAGNPKLTSWQIQWILDNEKDLEIRWKALKHKNANEELKSFRNELEFSIRLEGLDPETITPWANDVDKGKSTSIFQRRRMKVFEPLRKLGRVD